MNIRFCLYLKINICDVQMISVLSFGRSSVGTLFALPWFLTWFGHSLNSYRDVVRLYDYFLASPFLMPLYVTVAIVLYRENDIFKEDCDMASLHCLLSQVRKTTTKICLKTQNKCNELKWSILLAPGGFTIRVFINKSS